MPTSVGPATYGEENLVFGYDLGDTVNSYKGEPVYNRHDYDKSVMSQTGFNNWSCYDGNYTASYHTWNIAQSKTLVNIPGPDGKDTNAMLYYNFDGGFYGPTDWGGVPAAICTTGNKITLQAWVKAADAVSIGKTVTPYMYFSLNAGGAEATATNYTLTADWQLVSHTHTMSANATNYNNILYFFTQNSGAVRMYLTKTAVLSGIGHAVQWLPGGQTRSATQGLIDLKGNSTIDLTNVSFDSNAQMEFDGTDDFINLGSSTIWNLGQNGTIETVVRREGAASTNHRIWCTFNNSSHLDAYLDAATGGLYLHGGTVGTNTQIPLNQYLHIIVRYSGGTITIWYNGISQSLTGTTTGYSITNPSYTTLYLGRYVDESGYRWDGRITGFKVYNRALADSEIKSNFNAVKGRFGI